MHALTREARWEELEGTVLLHHGIFSFGPDARTSYERMISLVMRAEEYLERSGAGLSADFRDDPRAPDPEDLLQLAAHRRAVGRSKGAPVVARFGRTTTEREFSSRPDAVAILGRGPRAQETALLRAMLVAPTDRSSAFAMLAGLLAGAPAGHAGWTIPLEPLLRPVHKDPQYSALLTTLAARAA